MKMRAFNIYCDESCHLENDRQPVMILGATWCPIDSAKEIAKQIRAIKVKHQLDPDFEIKWTKVSPGKLDFYEDLLDYFLAENHLYFRAVIIPDKSILHHEAFQHSHDTWYYKMYFELLKVLINTQCRYHVYLDIKDTRSGEKVMKLREVLSNYSRDFERQVIENIQNVHSHQIQQVQLTDLLIGCVLAANKGSNQSYSKNALANKLCNALECPLTESTPFWQKKVNLFRWSGRER